MNARTASIVAVLILVGALVLLLRRGELLGAGPVSIAFQVIAVLLMLWARVTFGRRSFHAAANPTAGGLVTWGPYRYWRHPIYAAVLLFLWAGVLSHPLEPVGAWTGCRGNAHDGGANSFGGALPPRRVSGRQRIRRVRSAHEAAHSVRVLTGINRFQGVQQSP